MTMSPIIMLPAGASKLSPGTKPLYTIVLSFSSGVGVGVGVGVPTGGTVSESQDLSAVINAITDSPIAAAPREILILFSFTLENIVLSLSNGPGPMSSITIFASRLSSLADLGGTSGPVVFAGPESDIACSGLGAPAAAGSPPVFPSCLWRCSGRG